MKTKLFITISLLLTVIGINAADLKPRLVVMTDIGDYNVEPDDMESAIRLLSYADQFEIEGIMTTVGWNCDPYPEEWAQYLDKVVEAYGKDVKNLRKRSKQTAFQPLDRENGKQEIGYWPSMEYIKSRVMPGSHKAGIGIIGKENNTRGSEFLIKLADEDDDRPIYVAAWGSGNTLAQAIWKVKQTRTPEQLKAFLHKFRIYTITDQDMKFDMRMNRAYSSHMWLRKEFKDDLMFIWDEGTWNQQCIEGQNNWEKHKQLIQGHGEMGSMYPNYKYGVEGDTPSFLYAMPNGLSDPEDPTQAGWAGYHKWGMCPDSLTYAWTCWQEPELSASVGYMKRFYPDALNDFCARIQWAEEGNGNTNPIIYINGGHSLKPIHKTVKAGETVALDASMSKDAENNKLTYKWWIQPETQTIPQPVTIENGEAAKCQVNIPKGAQGRWTQIICEVHDDGKFNLVSYARIILEIE